MKTLYVTPSILLAVAVALGAPAASADTASVSTFQVTFTYNPDNDAQQIYADLRKAARKACKDDIGASTRVNWQLRSCTNSVVDAGVEMLARRDIADLHHRVAAKRL